MTFRFNPAPGWPPVPEGWLPPSGWAPDPSWPPAPAGWKIVLDDGQRSDHEALPYAIGGAGGVRRVSTSTIVLTVVAAVSSVSVILTLAGIPALVLAIASILTRANVERSRRLTKIGWITYGSIVALGIVATILDYLHNP